MNPTKRLISVLLTLALLLSLCAFASAEGGEAPVITYWCDLGAASSTITNYDENLTWQLVQEATGVDIQFMHPASGQGAEQFNLLIAGNELPDIIEYNWTSYAGGVQKAIDDKKIVPLNDYLDSYAPNLKALFESYPDLGKQVKTDDGLIPVFPALSISDYNCQSGYMIRKDWLDEAGLAVPQTIDEIESTLLTLMEQKNLVCGIVIPFGHLKGDAMVGAWDIGSAYYMDNGEVKYGPMQDTYLDYLTTMKRWYDEGVLDPDMAAMDTKTLESYMINDEAAMCFGFAGGNMGNIYTARELDGKDIDLEGMAYPVVNAGSHNRFPNVSWEYRGNGSAAITTACENIEAACKVLDYFFSDEGRIVKTYGQEGVTFEYVDGVPTYTELITKNPDGLTMGNALAKYLRANNPWVGYIETGYHEQFFARDVQKAAAKVWNQDAALVKETKLPMIALSSEESSELASVLVTINDYLEESVVKFIMGQESLDNFEAFREQLKALGIERVLEVYNTAVARYNAR